MTEENMFYVVIGTDEYLTVNPFARVLPILWCKDGEYRVFPKEILANALDVSGLQGAHYSDKNTKIQHAQIWWEQGVPVDNQVGRILSGE